MVSQCHRVTNGFEPRLALRVGPWIPGGVELVSQSLWLVCVHPPSTPQHATTPTNLSNALEGTFNIHKALPLRYNLESGFFWSPVGLGGPPSLGSTFGIHKGLPLRYNLERGFFGSPSEKKIWRLWGRTLARLPHPPPTPELEGQWPWGGQTGGPGALYGGMGRPVANPPPGTSWQASGLPGGNGEASGQPSPTPTS